MSFGWPKSDSTSKPVKSMAGLEADARATDTKALEQLKSLNGHPGRLTPSETKALERFRTLVTEAGLYTPASTRQDGTAGELASHTDATLCRFLRARRFDPEKAFKQFSDCEAWRKKHNVDELFRKFPVDEMEQAKKYYPTWTGRRDKRGLPVYVYRLADLDSKVQKELNAVPIERRYQRIVALFEYMFNGVLNLCGALSADAYPSSPSLPPDSSPPNPLRTRDQICSVSTIIDLSSVTLTQLWGVRGHLQQSSTLGTENYPETIDSIFVVNSPAFFPTVWGWIQGWFDVGTRNKIKILGNPLKDRATLNVLTSFIAPENLPRAYGGELYWQTGQPPALDEPARRWLKVVMGLEKLRGPVIVDPYAKDKLIAENARQVPTPGSKSVSEVDSGVGLDIVAVA